MRIAHEMTVCECCALWIENGDDTGCRDYWEHDHETCDLGLEPDESAAVVWLETPRSAYRCAGCGDDYVGGGHVVVILTA